jgi:hypothetical protein
VDTRLSSISPICPVCPICPLLNGHVQYVQQPLIGVGRTWTLDIDPIPPENTTRENGGCIHRPPGRRLTPYPIPHLDTCIHMMYCEPCDYTKETSKPSAPDELPEHELSEPNGSWNTDHAKCVALGKTSRSITSFDSTSLQEENAQVHFSGNGRHHDETPNSPSAKPSASPATVKKPPSNSESTITASTSTGVMVAVALSVVQPLLLTDG